MCSADDLSELTIELDLEDFESIAVEEPSFSRLELAFFAEGDASSEAEAA